MLLGRNNYEKHWWKSHWAAEVDHFIYILFRVGLTCDVIVIVQSSLKSISHVVQCIPSKVSTGLEVILQNVETSSQS